MPSFTQPFQLQASFGGATNPQFSISSGVPTPTTGRVNVNLTNLTGRAITGALYGVAASTASGNFNSSFANGQWVSDMRGFDFRFYRQQGEELLERTFSSQTSGPNFGWMQPFINGWNTAFPHAELQWTFGWLPGYWPNSGGNFNVPWGQQQINNLVSQCVQVAQFLKSNNIKVNYYELWNEPDIQGATGTGGTFTSPQVVGQTTAAVYPALAALDSSFQFGTSPTADPRVQSYIDASLAAYPPITYAGGHRYFGGNDQGLGNDIANSVALGNALSTGTPRLSLNEWALDYNGVSSGIDNIDEAVCAAIITSRGIVGGGLWATGVWDAAQSNFGFGPPPNYAPVAWFLSKAGQTMPGSMAVSNVSDGNTTVLATTGGIIVTNHNQGGTLTGGIAVGGLLNTTLHKWQQTGGNDHGSLSTINASALASESFPAVSNTIYYP